MNLIFGRTFDYTTREVLNWMEFLHRGKNILLTDNHRLEAFTIQISSESFTSNLSFKNNEGHAYSFRMEEINSMLYRSGKLTFAGSEQKKEILDLEAIGSHINNEMIKVQQYFHTFFETQTPASVGSYFNEINNNKLNNLILANQAGLNIPPLMVSNEKSKLLQFLEQHENVITKNIGNGISFYANQTTYENIYTTQVYKEDIETREEIFFPIFLQKKIDKLGDVRVFYLEGHFYAMMIFSQMNPETQLDFRNKKGGFNRMTPLQLPTEVEYRLRNLTNMLHLNTCSIDLILSPNNEYFFLEVNPKGEFGFVSKHCNYYLEKKVAQAVIWKNQKTF
jgi:hypothetical protein